jgi:high-affinity nickel-transport protein
MQALLSALHASGWQVLGAVALLLGMRHGLDADHLAAIDGLTRLHARAAHRYARYCGVLFSLGHGAIITACALMLCGAPGWQSPEWLEITGALTSLASLLLLAALNLRSAFARGDPAGEAARVAGLRARLLAGRTSCGGAWTVFGVGALFAVSFDTLGIAAMLGMSALSAGGAGRALWLAMTFTLGMLLADGANGLWLAQLLRRPDQIARQGARIMSIAVAAASLLVALFGICTLLSPRFAAWSAPAALLLSLSVPAIVLVAYAIAGRRGAVRSTRRTAA